MLLELMVKRMKSKDKMYLYRFFRVVLGFIFKLYYNPTIINKENIPKDGPLIIAGNHKHLFDQCLAIIATKRPIHYMAKKEYFEGKFAWFFKAMGCICVKRDGNDKEASTKALEVLKNDLVLGIFPEGTRNRTSNKLLPFKYGAVSLANKSGALIVPFAITGKFVFRSQDLTIRFGKAFKVSGNLEEDNKFLEDSVVKLLDKNIGKSVK